jgi:CRISPR-associated protein Csh1
MIKELVQFTQHLPEDVKKAGILPKEGLHILLNMRNDEGKMSIDLVNYQYEIYNKPKPGEKPALSNFLERCAMLSNHAWCVDTNKCFDTPDKAIHSCSPYCVAFKREHLKGGGKYKETKGKKKGLHDRFEMYFNKALSLLVTEGEIENMKLLEFFFTNRDKSGFEDLLRAINIKNEDERNKLGGKINELKEQLKNEMNKDKKEEGKEIIKDLENQKSKYRELEDSDYIIFYVNESLDKYQAAHEVYLKNNLFNTTEYNTLDEYGNAYGSSNFYNGFNKKMPFLLHQTATFDVTARISGMEAKELYNFEKIMGRRFVPNPLPIFIYKEELQQGMISVFRKNIERGERMGYQEVVKELWTKHKSDFSDYYLLFHQNTKEGVVFNDFDFVSKYEFELRDEVKDLPYWEIFNLFELKEKKEGGEKAKNKFYPKLYNVFDLERTVFGSVLANKYKSFDFYFKELEKKDFEQLDFTLIAVRKYRKAVYDYIYKSRRQSINNIAIKEIMLLSIKDDLKYGREYAIKEKLNIWFSLNNYFDKENINFNNYYMPDKLNQLMEKTMTIADSKERIPIVDVYEFAFISGQLIDFLLSKSQSSDNSHNLLEAFLQKNDLELFKREISKYFSRYKHAVERDDNGRFGRLMREVMGFDKPANMQELITFVLSGYFSNSFYYTKKNIQES